MSNSFATPWTVAHQPPLFMGFSRQEHWSGLPHLLQGIFPTQGWNPVSCLGWWVLYRWATGKAKLIDSAIQMYYAMMIFCLPVMSMGRRVFLSFSLYFLPGKSHGWRSLVGCSPWGSQRVVHDWATSLSLFTFLHWRRKWQPTPVFLPGESQGQGSLVGCHLWGHTESDTTEVT